MNSGFAFLQIMLESLPISSSGHLQLLGLHVVQDFDRFLHGPTIVVIMLYFLPELLSFFRQKRLHDKHNYKNLFSLLVLVVLANSFTVLVYALLQKYAVQIPLWFGFFITGVLLVISSCDVWRKYSVSRTPTTRPLEDPLEDPLKDPAMRYLVVMSCIGLAQGVARLAGISRLGITYSVARLLGCSPSVSFRLSCLLQVPLFGLGFLEGGVGLYKDGLLADMLSPFFLCVIMIGMVCAYLLLWLVEVLIVRQKVWLLGVYMIVLSMITYGLHI